jgi:PIN domain nuclease of toxin-antitoxin system
VTQDTAPVAVLLDTSAVIWLVNAEPLSVRVRESIRHAGRTDGVYVSIASAWEIGMLGQPRATRKSMPQFWPAPKTWFPRLMAMPGIKEAPITPAIAIGTSYLPGDFLADPMDRLIVATARDRGIPIVTSDPKIIACAGAGHVRVIPC